MKTMKHIQTWLLITLLALSANGAVSAKVASGGINLSNEVHQGLNDSKSLNALGISDVSTIYALSSSIVPNAGGITQPTRAMQADPYHPDWKNYSGARAVGAVGADVVKPQGLEATKITDKGVDRVERHLTQTPGIEAGPAELKMIERLRAGERTLQDLRFYQHEIIESRKINKTKNLYDDLVDAARDAHHRTLINQDLYRRGYQEELYHPEAQELFE